MFLSRKSGARRAGVRKNRPDTAVKMLREFSSGGTVVSLWVAAFFCATVVCIVCMREHVVRYRSGQYAMHDIVSRVDFTYLDPDKVKAERARARDDQPRVYHAAQIDPWANIEHKLVNLPDRVDGVALDNLPPDLAKILDEPTLAMIQDARRDRTAYDGSVHDYIAAVRKLGLVILPDQDRADDIGSEDIDRKIIIPGLDAISAASTYPLSQRDEIAGKFAQPASDNFKLALQPKIVALTAAWLTPTHELDDAATADARNQAELRVPLDRGKVYFKASMPIVKKGPIKDEDWAILQAENNAYLQSMAGAVWQERLGLAVIVILLTVLLCAYIAKYQPRIVRNHARAVAIAVMLILMLLLPVLAGIGNSSLYLFGLAPTILVAMILTIAYDQRFALGVATVHAALVTLALDADINFFLILLAGVVTCCFMLNDLRSRSKLIEVGGITALAMMATTAAAGMINMDMPRFIIHQCLFAGAAGLAVGFVVLGILPTIEKAFRITTSMTLLELADLSQPLMRRLSMEAPGTYQHSLQVATLAAEAAEEIGANALLCRVAAHYHDIGKINKPDYFIENQTPGNNRHLNLHPNMSLMIIHGHVKDGIELAREYNLPTSLFPFIQQHHGTTLVEFFYHRACTQQEQTHPDEPAISETQYRYPGPKPKTKETAILMLADAVESATRAMTEPNAGRIEALVHELAMKRLMDGQFDDSDLTMRDLSAIEGSLVKTLLSFYHGRIAYPSTAGLTGATTGPVAAQAAGPTMSSARTA
jgi:putative nucleotidyltransferase with HDIG domain